MRFVIRCTYHSTTAMNIRQADAHATTFASAYSRTCEFSLIAI